MVESWDTLPLIAWCIAGGFIAALALLSNWQTSGLVAGLRESLGLKTVHGTVVLLVIFVWATVFALLLIGMAAAVVEALKATTSIMPNASPNSRPIETPTDLSVFERRFPLLTLAAFTATLTAVVALPFTLLRTQFNRRQTETAEERIRLDRENELTDRIYKAVEGLGSERTITRMGRHVTLTSRGHPDLPSRKVEWQDNPMPREPEVFDYEPEPWTAMAETRPNIEVRIGAIYALERLARKNLDVHVQIMEILCAYIRENAPASKAAPGPEFPLSPDSGTAERQDKGEPLVPSLEAWAQIRSQTPAIASDWKENHKPRSDIATALEVLSRRRPEQKRIEAQDRGNDGKWVFSDVALEPVSDEDDPNEYRNNADATRQGLADFGGYRPDLRGTDLQGADLSAFDLRGWNLQGAKLQGANLRNAQLQGANLSSAALNGANAKGADMLVAILSNAELTAANLAGSELRGASFRNAVLRGANLRGADMRGANFGSADLQGTNLRSAKITAADLWDAEMQGANLRGARMNSANLRGAKMQGANLGGVKLGGAILVGTEMQGVNLGGAEFDKNTDLRIASVRGAMFRSVQPEAVKSWREYWHDFFADSTIMPDSLDRPAHWLSSNFEGDLGDNWHAWQATLPEGWDRTWPEDLGRNSTPESRAFWARWNAWLAEQGAPPRTFD